MPQHSPALFQAWFAVRRADTRLKTVVGTVLAAVAASLLVASPARAEVTADWQPKAPR